MGLSHNEFGFTENVDFAGFEQKSTKPQGGRPRRWFIPALKYRVRWNRVNKYLNVSPQVAKGDFITEPYFVGKDAALAIGYKNFRDALNKHVKAKYKRESQIATPSGTQTMTLISEPGE